MRWNQRKRSAFVLLTVCLRYATNHHPQNASRLGVTFARPAGSASHELPAPLTSSLFDGAGKRAADVLLLVASDELEQDDYDSLIRFSKAGGGLIYSGQAWFSVENDPGLSASMSDFPANKVLYPLEVMTYGKSAVDAQDAYVVTAAVPQPATAKRAAGAEAAAAAAAEAAARAAPASPSLGGEPGPSNQAAADAAAAPVPPGPSGGNTSNAGMVQPAPTP